MDDSAVRIEHGQEYTMSSNVLWRLVRPQTVTAACLAVDLAQLPPSGVNNRVAMCAHVGLSFMD